MQNNLREKIEQYYDGHVDARMFEAINEVISLLSSGAVRAIDPWVKKAILLLFKHTKCSPQAFDSYDKIGLLPYDYKNPRYRKVSGALIRNGVYIGDDCVIMPSYINIGAYIGRGTMVDINAAVGSCAQIGANCHISANVCIGGVLEPVVASPVIIQDNCLIGAGAAILEGAIIGSGSVIAPGVVVSSGTRIMDRESGEELQSVPENSVVVPGSYPSKNGVNISCAVVVKRVDSNTVKKSGLNAILRECLCCCQSSDTHEADK